MSLKSVSEQQEWGSIYLEQNLSKICPHLLILYILILEFKADSHQQSRISKTNKPGRFAYPT